MFDFILMVYSWFIVLVGTIVVGVLNAFIIVIIYKWFVACFKHQKDKEVFDIENFSNRVKQACRECNDTCAKINRQYGKSR